MTNPTRKPALSPREVRRVGFAKNLSALILDANISQSDLARMTGLGRDSISGYVLGKSVPSPENAERIARALGVPLSKLQPATARVVMEPGKPFLHVETGGSSETAWLQINQRVSIRTALKIAEMIKADQGR